MEQDIALINTISTTIKKARQTGCDQGENGASDRLGYLQIKRSERCYDKKANAWHKPCS